MFEILHAHKIGFLTKYVNYVACCWYIVCFLIIEQVYKIYKHYFLKLYTEILDIYF